MQVTLTITFNDEESYERYLLTQAVAIAGAPVGGITLKAESVTLETEGEAVPDMPGGATQTEPVPEKPRRTRTRKSKRPPKTHKKDATGPAVTEPTTSGVEDALPVAPTTEAAPAEGEKELTLADSRDILIGYLAKEGNDSATLLKELAKHKAARINEVPQEHIHGFLKRMIAAS